MGKVYTIKEVFYSPQGEGHRVGTMNTFVRFTGCNLQCISTDHFDPVTKAPMLPVDSVSFEHGSDTRLRPLMGNEVNASFFCDTDFYSGDKLTLQDLLARIEATRHPLCKNVIFTGGEPSLQLDSDLCMALKDRGFYLAIETNGTRSLPVNPRAVAPPGSALSALDWVSCSPKPGTRVELKWANEVRCVVREGQVPDTRGIESPHRFVSPAAWAPPADVVRDGTYVQKRPDGTWQRGRWRSDVVDLAGPEQRGNLEWVVKWCGEHPDWRVSLQTHKILGVR